MSGFSLPKEHPVRKILSLGAGVNSTALLVLKELGKVDFESVVFSDTGGEHPETYEFLDRVIRPYCDKLGVELFYIKRDGQPLYETYLEKRIIPTRMYRHCSDKFKIQPLKKFAMSNYPNQDIQFIIGFCKGEEHRAEKFCLSKFASFPLIDLGIDREGCKQLIKDAGLPVPIKSGCYFCPHTRVKNWKWLKRTHPELFNKAIKLEQNCMRYPDLTLHQGSSLEKVVSKKEMCDFITEPCSFCEVD
jgi:hypothetical protein